MAEVTYSVLLVSLQDTDSRGVIFQTKGIQIKKEISLMLSGPYTLELDFLVLLPSGTALQGGGAGPGRIGREPLKGRTHICDNYKTFQNL